MVAHLHVLEVSVGNSLGLGDWAVLVCEQHSFESDDLIAKDLDLAGKIIVLLGEHLDLGLEVGEPLLLALTALESGNAREQKLAINVCLWRHRDGS